MKNELYKAIKNYCEENHCWGAYNTAKEWNEMLNTTYSPATFTALVNTGHLVKDKWYGEKCYSYALAETAEMREKRLEAERERDIKHAHWVIEHYEESVAKRKAKYEEEIANAEKWLKEDLEHEDKCLAEAKALLGIE